MPLAPYLDDAWPVGAWPTNGAVLDASQARFGTQSLRLVRVGNQFLVVDLTSDVRRASGDFTVEAFYRWSGDANNVQQAALSLYSPSSPFYSTLYRAPSGSSMSFVIGGTTVGSAGGSVPSALWHHLALTRTGSTLTAWFNGVAVGSGSFSPLLTGIDLGVYTGAIGTQMDGWVDSFRFTHGAARYTGAFTPPSVEFGLNVGDDARWADVRSLLRFESIIQPIVAAPSPAASVLGAFPPTWPVTPRSVPGAGLVINVRYGGNGKIVGTVKVKGTPDAPVRRRVLLFRELDGILAGLTYSDPVTGYYEFVGIDPALLYTVIAYDGPRVYRAAVSDAVSPVPAF